MKNLINSFNSFMKNVLEIPNTLFYMGEHSVPKLNYKYVSNVIYETVGLVFLTYLF